ncbi:MAG: hypothetical protein A4E73_01694 [Syntrophaceae bacterium PtaU1.Bin231]|nr:MAG: hypothetical protein A4E73_01694 [Syntrophaceae bacterium PtaU1.Bin231]
MAKAPAFQFYFKDWLSDPQLKMASHSTKGIWADMLCFMFPAPVRGELTGTKEQLRKLVSATESDMERFWSEATTLLFCDISVTDNEIVTVRNRRMWREEKDKKDNRERQARYRGKHKNNGEITSLSPSPSPKKEKILKEKIEFDGAKFIHIPDDLMQKWTSIAPGISVQNEITKAEAWVLSNPKLKKSNWSRFLTNWITRAQDRAGRTGGNGNGAYQRLDKFGKPAPRQKWEDEADRINADYYRRKAQDAPDGKTGKDPG